MVVMTDEHNHSLFYSAFILQERLDTVAEAGLPIWITEFSVEEPDAIKKGNSNCNKEVLLFASSVTIAFQYVNCSH